MAQQKQLIDDSAVRVGVRQVRPFLRWAGSKRLLVPQLKAVLPEHFSTYYEPFLGSGALLLALQPPRALVSDALTPLIQTWEAIRDNLDEVLVSLDNWPFNRETYLHLREADPSLPTEIAAQFLYLNRGAYGGLWRVNRMGQFNVPWSEPKTSSAINRDNLRLVSNYLRQSVQISNADFESSSSTAEAGDLVFFDPPYSRSRLSRPFIEYNETLFDWSEQKRLASHAESLRKRGVHVIVTNSPHPDVRELFANFKFEDVLRHSSLGSHAQSSRLLSERIFYYHGDGAE